MNQKEEQKSAQQEAPSDQAERPKIDLERGYRPAYNRYRKRPYRQMERTSRYEEYPSYRYSRVEEGASHPPRGYKSYPPQAYRVDRYRGRRPGYEAYPGRWQEEHYSFYDQRPRTYYKKRVLPAEQVPVNVLGIFGIDIRVSEDELKQWLNEKLESLPFTKTELVLDKYTGYSRGYAFVYFDTVEEATAAKGKLTDQMLNGSIVRVEYSITPSGHAKREVAEESKEANKEAEEINPAQKKNE